MNEKWKSIAGFEGLYEVSDAGRVRTARRKGTKGGILQATERHSGHLAVKLCKAGKYTAMFVHRLVLDAFVGVCPDGMEACHNDGDPKNNNLGNLRWDTHLANVHDSIRHGTLRVGERCSFAKISEIDVREIRRLAEHGHTQVSIGARFSISRTQVSKIVNRQRWAHLGNAP